MGACVVQLDKLCKSKQMPNATSCAGAIVWVGTYRLYMSKPVQFPSASLFLRVICVRSAAVVTKATDTNRHTQAKKGPPLFIDLAQPRRGFPIFLGSLSHIT